MKIDIFTKAMGCQKLTYQKISFLEVIHLKKRVSAEKKRIRKYVGNYIYENNVLKQFSHAEGYVEPNGNSWQYVYRYTDIWNNTRITYADDNNDGVITASSEIRREQNYYPGGLEHKGYNNVLTGVKNNLKTFQGQEFTEDLGLNIHEWKYRISDPAILRFWQIDPLAEDYVYNSTYAFAENKLGMGRELEGLEIIGWEQLAMSDAIVNPNGVGAHTIGISQGLTNTVTGIYDAITSPVQTLKGMGNLLVMGVSQGSSSTMLAIDNAIGSNSFGTSMAMGQAIDGAVNDVVSGNGIERGTVIGEVIGATLGTKGTTAGLKGASTALKATKLSPVQKALNTLNKITADGGQVNMNKLQTGQELNMTVTKGTGKLDVRIETHTVPKKYGGNGTTPQRHMNVDLYPKKSSPLPNKGHKILDDF